MSEPSMIFEPVTISGPFDPRIAAKGKCARCGHEHGTAVGYAAPYAKRLLHALTEKKRIDFHAAPDRADPGLSTDVLWGEPRGQMFGVLVCRDKAGQTGVLKAFSGQFNGQWDVPGWVGPLVNTRLLHDMSVGVERYIKQLTARIERTPKETRGYADLVEHRRAVSQALMKDIHNLYRIPNFRGELKPLREVVPDGTGIPTGTADCCAPKLLGHAARHAMTPLGLAEFFVGRENRSGTRKHGNMYASCKGKCGLVIGHMLCGLGHK